MMRTEWGAALVASAIGNVNRGADTPVYRISDFAPHIKEPAISLNEAMEQWT